MSYKMNFQELSDVFLNLEEEYDIYAPKRFPNQGRYSDTDIIRYDKVHSPTEIVFSEKSDYPAKEVLSPITQTLFYFTEDEYRDSKVKNKKVLIFMRPCDIHAQQRQEKIYLGNGGFEDLYYKRLHDKVKIILMECTMGWDTCFCVSMGTNQTDQYDAAIRVNGENVSIEVKDETLMDYFKGSKETAFTPEYIVQNNINLKIPEITDRELLTQLKNHTFWKEYDKRCISCGSCTVACSTCTCFTTTDVIYNENTNVGERKRTTSSCQIEGFTNMAGGHSFRNTAGDRMRYKVLHKFHDYKERFKDFHMCTGCGRCTERCPEFISITATVNKMGNAIEELMSHE